MDQKSSVDSNCRIIPSVIDLRGDRSGVQRVLELAGPDSDPGWIAGLLNREGYASSSGRPWSPEDVLALIRSSTTRA